MRMERRKFRIGELATHLKVERFVIRFWEKEFAIKTSRSIGGQRFYSEHDLQTFTIIKELLYQKGFTIAGARKYIGALPRLAQQQLNNYVETVSVNNSQENNTQDTQDIMHKLIALKKQLIQLQKLL